MELKGLLDFLILQKKALGRGFSEYGSLNEIPLPSISKSQRFAAQEPGSTVGVNEALDSQWGLPIPETSLAKEVMLSWVSSEKGTGLINQDIDPRGRVSALSYLRVSRFSRDIKVWASLPCHGCWESLG